MAAAVHRGPKVPNSRPTTSLLAAAPTCLSQLHSVNGENDAHFSSIGDYRRKNVKCVVKKLVFLAITKVISLLELCLLNPQFRPVPEAEVY